MLSIVSMSVIVPPYSLLSSVLQHKSVLPDNGKAIQMFSDFVNLYSKSSYAEVWPGSGQA